MDVHVDALSRSSTDTQMSLRGWLHERAAVNERILDKLVASLEAAEVFDAASLRVLSELPQFDTILKPVTAAKIRAALAAEPASTHHARAVRLSVSVPAPKPTPTPAPMPSTAPPVRCLARPSAAADGCRYVFLDVGGHIGVHARFVFEPSSYPNSSYLPFLARFLPTDRNRSDVCVFGLEPNPRHRLRLLQLQAAYARRGWRVRYLHAAASTKDGTLSFHRANEVNDTINLEWGFRQRGRSKASTAVTVPSVDLAAWVAAEVHGRIVPPAKLPSDPEPAVLMKVDIEGSEWVMPHTSHTPRFPNAACSRDRQSSDPSRLSLILTDPTIHSLLTPQFLPLPSTTIQQ